MNFADQNTNISEQSKQITSGEGRTCNGPLCFGKFHTWDQFDLKSDSYNGRNPICKKCISHKRKFKRKALRQQSRTPENFISIIVGQPGRDVQLEVGEILGRSIVTLLEQGHLK